MAKYKQLSLFEEDQEIDESVASSEAPSAASTRPQYSNLVPHYTYALSHPTRTACISIQTGTHVEDFRLHHKSFTPEEFELRVRELARTLLEHFRDNEIFLRRLIMARYDRDRPIRVPPFEPTGSALHKHAQKLAQEYRP